jgi:hypothetical protein
VTQYSDTGCVGRLHVCPVSQRAIWSSLYVKVQEEKVAIHLSPHHELYVGMNVVEVVKSNRSSVLVHEHIS